MPRTYNKKGIHTSPEKAGKQNLEPILDTLPKLEGEDASLNKKINAFYKRGIQNEATYHGNWTDEEFINCVAEFFDYCAEVDLKPTQPALRLWLNVSKTQMYDWRTKPEKYGVKSTVIETAFNIMEMYLQSNIDKYPTGSIFLLKTSHGHVEASKIDITTNGKDINNPEDVDDIVKKLGLDQAK